MKNLKTLGLILILTIAWWSCQKNDNIIKPEGLSTIPNNGDVIIFNSPLNTLQKSKELQTFRVQAGSLASLINVDVITEADLLKASKISSTLSTQKDFDNWCLAMHVDSNKIIGGWIAVVNTYQAYNKAHGLAPSNMTNYMWQQALTKDPPLVPQAYSSGSACIGGAIAIFLIESAGCLALNSLPIGGQFLSIMCGQGAIAHLTMSILECKQKDKGISVYNPFWDKNKKYPIDVRFGDLIYTGNTPITPGPMPIRFSGGTTVLTSPIIYSHP